MEMIKSRVVSILDQESINQIRQIIKEETRKIVREETADLKAEQKEIISKLKSAIINLDTTIIRSSSSIISLNTDILELKSKLDDFLRLVEENKKLDQLKDEFINHTHEIVIETGEAETEAV
jgi:hypothetical protein